MSSDLFTSNESSSESVGQSDEALFSSYDTDEIMDEIIASDEEPPSPDPPPEPEKSEETSDFKYKLRPGRSLPTNGRMDFFMKLHEVDILPRSEINNLHVDYD